MSRLRIFFLFAALTALATAFVACGDSGGSSSANPQTVVDNATLQGIESGNLALSIILDVEGEDGGSVDVSLSGPFQSQGGGGQQLPARHDGQSGRLDQRRRRRLRWRPRPAADRAYVNYKGVEYEVDPTTFNFIKSLSTRPSGEPRRANRRHRLQGRGQPAPLQQPRRQPDDRGHHRRRRRRTHAQRRPQRRRRDRPSSTSPRTRPAPRSWALPARCPRGRAEQAQGDDESGLKTAKSTSTSATTTSSGASRRATMDAPEARERTGASPSPRRDA